MKPSQFCTPVYLLTLRAEDVGKSTIHVTCQHCGMRKPVYVAGAIGPVQPYDVGKRVYEVGAVIQVESNAQRDDRRRRGAWPERCATGRE